MIRVLHSPFPIPLIFQPDAECLPRDRMDALQSRRLVELVRYVAARVPMYRDRLADRGINPATFRGLEDLSALPVTRKADLRDHYPFGLVAVPRTDVVRVHASSGTTGKSTVVAYTRADLDVFSDVCARSLAMAGAEPGMMLHNAYGYGLFTGGLGLHYGGERLGMTVVPVSGGVTDRQVTLLTDFRPEVLSCTPSYALTLAAELARKGIDPSSLALRYSLHGAEPWTDSMRVQIEAGLGVQSTNIYGLSEIIGPGVSNECVEARDGSHINEDHFLPEILDPDSAEPVPDGAYGVLVLTTLTKQALPLLRYWTGDITSITRAPCICGRTLARMRLIRGRTDDMLIIRGVNVYPSQIESVLAGVDGLAPHYRLVVTRKEFLDELEVQAEVLPDSPGALLSSHSSSDSLTSSEVANELKGRLISAMQRQLGLNIRVTLLAPGEAPRSDGGKLNRVVDRRTSE